jgi:peptidoglycan/xylan/chitin deacetylase (PgdA/CDA1 family)
MRKRGMPFTLFVYPAIVGKGAHYLTWDQIEELSRDGVDIESHTYSHPFLTAARHPEMSKEAYAAFLQHELADSRAEIEAHTGKPVHFIAYPYSEYDAGVIEAAQGAGYLAGLYDREVGAFILPNTPAMRMKRFPIKHDTTLDEFKTYLP